MTDMAWVDTEHRSSVRDLVDEMASSAQMAHSHRKYTHPSLAGAHRVGYREQKARVIKRVRFCLAELFLLVFLSVHFPIPTCFSPLPLS